MKRRLETIPLASNGQFEGDGVGWGGGDFTKEGLFFGWGIEQSRMIRGLYHSPPPLPMCAEIPLHFLD